MVSFHRDYWSKDVRHNINAMNICYYMYNLLGIVCILVSNFTRRSKFIEG